MRASVVVPTYNEAENIEALCRQLRSLEPIGEIIVVDDGSPDGTAARVIALANELDGIILISREKKLGLGSAYATGMKLALSHGAEAVITMDADFSHDPAAIPALIDGMDRYDLMIGSRYVDGGKTENWGLGRRLLSGAANALTRLFLRIPVRDCTAGFRCYKRAVLQKIDPGRVQSNGYSYLEEMLLNVVRAGFSVGETPITFRNREAGVSKSSVGEAVKGLTTLIRLLFAPPKFD